MKNTKKVIAPSAPKATIDFAVHCFANELAREDRRNNLPPRNLDLTTLEGQSEIRELADRARRQFEEQRYPVETIGTPDADLVYPEVKAALPAQYARQYQRQGYQAYQLRNMASDHDLLLHEMATLEKYMHDLSTDLAPSEQSSFGRLSMLSERLQSCAQDCASMAAKAKTIEDRLRMLSEMQKVYGVEVAIERREDWI